MMKFSRHESSSVTIPFSVREGTEKGTAANSVPRIPPGIRRLDSLAMDDE